MIDCSWALVTTSGSSLVALAKFVPPPRVHRHRYHGVLERIYDVLPLLCPACGAEMRIIAFLTDPPVVAAILLHLDLPHTPPAFDLAEPDPVPDFEFDQSLPNDVEPYPLPRATSTPAAKGPLNFLSLLTSPPASVGFGYVRPHRLLL